MWTDRRHMNVEIGTEPAQFPEKEYINGIFFAVQCTAATSWNGKNQNGMFSFRFLFCPGPAILKLERGGGGGGEY